MSHGSKMIEMMKLIENSEGFKIQTKMKNLDLSYYVLTKNTQELIELLRAFKSSFGFAGAIMQQENRQGFEAYLSEVTRLLHNYLAAAKTLIDHTRKFVQDEYRDTDFEREYSEQIKVRFAENPISKFIQDLRNYSLHRTLPITGATMNFAMDSGISHSINIVKKELLEWDNWTSHARTYLDRYEKEIELYNLIKEYTQNVEEFQKWFRMNQIEIHTKEFKELSELQQEYLKLYKQIPKGLR